MGEVGETPPPIQPEAQKPAEGSKDISRRDFLRQALHIMGAVAAASLLPNLIPKNAATQAPAPGEPTPAPAETPKPKEKEETASILTIDFFDGFEQFINQVLKDRFPEVESSEQILAKIGVKDPTTEKGLKEGVPTSEAEALALFLTGLKIHYESHGKTVIQARQKAEELFGNTPECGSPPKNLNEASLLEAVQIGDLIFDDKLKNPTFYYQVSADVVERLIGQSSDDCVNMSFELGEFATTYKMYFLEKKHPEIDYRDVPHENKLVIDGKETITYENMKGQEFTKEEAEKIIAEFKEREVKLLEPKDRDIKAEDGYEGKNTFSNLSLLAALVKKYPDKFFIAAAGNPTAGIPDITEARKRLAQENKWPDNLLTVGVYGPTQWGDRTYAFGADLYVQAEDLKKLGFPEASSFATPVVTEIVSQLRTFDQDPQWIRETLQEMSKNIGLAENPCFVLDLEMVKNNFITLRPAGVEKKPPPKVANDDCSF